MIEAPDLTRSPGVLFGAGGVDVVGTTERVREVPRPITASDVVIGTRRRLPRNQVIPAWKVLTCDPTARSRTRRPKPKRSSGQDFPCPVQEPDRCGLLDGGMPDSRWTSWNSGRFLGQADSALAEFRPQQSNQLEDRSVTMPRLGL